MIKLFMSDKGIFYIFSVPSESEHTIFSSSDRKVVLVTCEIKVS